MYYIYRKEIFYLRRIDILKNEDAEYISQVIASFLNEEIEIKNAPEGSSCSNCYWNNWKELKGKSCHAPFHYIGMQYYDCFQYRPME